MADGLGLGSASAPVRAPAPAAADSVERRVADVIRRVLHLPEVEKLESGTLLEDLGADSLDTVDLAMRLEEEFAVSLGDDPEITARSTIADIARAVEAAQVGGSGAA